MNDTIKKVGLFLAGAALVGGGVVVSDSFPKDGILIDKTAILEEQVQPTTDLEWSEAVKGDAVDIKTDSQLSQMEISHKNKLARFEKMIDDINICPECKRQEIIKSHPEMSKQEVDEEFTNEILGIEDQYKHLFQAVEHITKEEELRQKGFVKTSADSKSEQLKVDPSLVRKLNP